MMKQQLTWSLWLIWVAAVFGLIGVAMGHTWQVPVLITSVRFTHIF